MSSRAVLPIVNLMLIVVIGCNGSGGLSLVPVSGNVTFDGGPPPSAGTITFTPIRVEEGLPNRPATAQFDEQGAFQVTSFKPNDGLVPGTYHANITCWLSQPSSDDPTSFERLNAVPKDFRPDEVVVEPGARSVHVEFDVPRKR